MSNRVLLFQNVLSLWDAVTFTPVWNWPSLPIEQFLLTTEADSPSSVTWYIGTGQQWFSQRQVSCPALFRSFIRICVWKHIRNSLGEEGPIHYLPVPIWYRQIICFYIIMVEQDLSKQNPQSLINLSVRLSLYLSLCLANCQACITLIFLLFQARDCKPQISHSDDYN